MRDLLKMTLAEADAYRLGYQDGRAAWAAERRLEDKRAYACKVLAGAEPCEGCNCWKQFREMCS